MDSLEKETSDSSLPAVRIGVSALSGVALGLLALVLYVLGAHFGILLLKILGATSIYIAALFLPSIGIRVALLTFSFTLLLNDSFFFDSLRIFVIATVLALPQKRIPILVPPFYIVAILWLLTFSIHQGFYNSEQFILLKNPGFAFLQASGEVLCLLFVGLLTNSPGIPKRFRYGTSLISLQNYLPHVVALALWGSTAMVFVAAMLIAGHSLDLLFIDPQTFGAIGLVLLGAFIVAPLIGGRIIYRLIMRSLSLVEEGIASSHVRHKIAREALLFGEFTDIIQRASGTRSFSRVGTNDSAAVPTSGSGSSYERVSGSSGRHPTLQAKTPDTFNSALILHLPYIFIAVDSRGSILAVSDITHELCRLEKPVIGKNISSLSPKSKWAEELVTHLYDAYQTFNRDKKAEPRRWLSSVTSGKRLEGLIEPFEMQSELELPPIVSPSKPQRGAILCARLTPALEKLQLSLLTPSSLKLTGSRAIELCNEFRGECHNIVSELNKVSEKVSRVQNPSITVPERNETALELTIHHKKIKSYAEKAEKSLDLIVSQLNIEPTPKQQIDFIKLIEDCVTYINALTHSVDGITLNIERDTLRTASGAPIDPTRSAILSIFAPGSSVTNFLESLLSLLCFIRRHTKHVKIDLGQENIPTGSAIVIPGSYPGDYARLTIQHEGQSVTTTMNLQTSGHMSNLESVDTALYLFSIATKKLGGFLTIQSSSSRGTHITVYLPLNDNSSQSITRRTVSTEATTAQTAAENESSQTIENNVLLVGSDSDNLAKMTKMLEKLGYAIYVRRPEVLLEEFNRPVDFSGSGFWATSFETDEEAAVAMPSKKSVAQAEHSIALNLAPFSILVFNVELATNSTLALLQQLLNHNPEAKTLVVLDPAAEDCSRFSKWATLERPFDLKKLESALGRAKNP